MDIDFDPTKNAENLRKHGVDFADVEGVFYDEFALTDEDTTHGEQRFLTLGMDGFGRILVVCYTYRDPDTIRIISARKADPQQRKQYER